MATTSHLGTGTFTTAAGNKTVTATPAVGDHIIVIAPATGVATSAVTDNNADGKGTYTKIGSSATGFSTAGDLSMWVRNFPIGSATSTVFTATQTSSTGGGLDIIKTTGMSIFGSASIRGSGRQSTGTLGTTPAPVLSVTPLTTNPVIGAIGNGTSAATLTPRTGFTEASDLGYATPTTGMETMFTSSGQTTTTQTWGSTSATAFASMVIELDASQALVTPKALAATSTIPLPVIHDGTVKFDTLGPTAAGVGSSTTPLTWSHTNNGNCIIVEVTAFSGSTNNVTGVTYGGVSLTFLGYLSSGVGGGGGISKYGLIGGTVPTGTNTVSVAFSAANSHLGGSISLIDAGSFGTPVTKADVTVTTVTTTITGTTTGGMIVSGVCQGGSGTFTATAPNVKRIEKLNSSSSGADNLAIGTDPSTGGGSSQNVVWTCAVSDDWGVIAVEVLPASGSSNATVTPTTVAATSSIPNPGAQTGTLILVTCVNATASIPTPTVRISSTFTVTAVAATSSIPAPVVTTTARAPPNAVSATSSIPTPQVSTGTLVTPTVVSGTSSIPSPTVRVSVLITPTTVAATSSIPLPTVTAPSGALVTPTTVSATSSIPVPGINIGTTVTPSSLAATANIPIPVLSAGSKVTPSAVSGTSSIPQPVTTVTINVLASVVAATASIPTPVVSAGCLVTPTTVSATATIPIPSVSAGGSATVAANAVNATSSIPVPVITAIRNVTVTPSTVAVSASIPTPVAKTGSTVTPTAVSASASILSPSVTTSSGSTATPVTVAASSSIPTPTVTVSVLVQPTTVNATVSIPSPSLRTSAVLTPVTIQAQAFIPVPVIPAQVQFGSSTVSTGITITAEITNVGTSKATAHTGTNSASEISNPETSKGKVTGRPV